MDLFDEATYRRLGFLDHLGAAREALPREGREGGMPLDALLGDRLRRGYFMHTINPNFDRLVRTLTA
jgi:hypothetical protein